MKVDHIGIACKDLLLARQQYEELGFVARGPVVSDLGRNLDYLFLSNGNFCVELIAVHNASVRSDIDTILKQDKIPGNKMYHLCFVTQDMPGDILKFKGVGYKLVKEPLPAIACDDRNVAFMFHPDFGMIEFLDAAPTPPTCKT